MFSDSRAKKTEQPATFKDKVLSNRTLFSVYNIARLRRFVESLPEEKQAFFFSLPLLLHINSPELPGYVDHPQASHGIYLFFDSGFWHLAKQSRQTPIKDFRNFSLRMHYVRGLYLMDRAGCLSQSDYSDFSFLVLIDDRAMNPIKRELLQEKLNRIQAWALEKYDQRVTFPILNSAQLKQNGYIWELEEDQRTVPDSLLKEEFYRSFIMIAGEMPCWAIMPVGLKDDHYRSWMDAIVRLADNNVFTNDYVDLGNIPRISGEDCVNGFFRELCHAANDPVNAFIRASIIAYHYFQQDLDGLLCNVVKRSFPQAQRANFHGAPFLFITEKTTHFYGKVNDLEGRELIRQCIYLRALGYPRTFCLKEGIRRRELLMPFIKAWSWDFNKIDHLDKFIQWPEEERVRFEERIRQKLLSLFEMISYEEEKKSPDNKNDHHQQWLCLRENAAALFNVNRARLPRCSSMLHGRESNIPLGIICNDPSSWAISDCPENKLPENDSQYHFHAPEPLRVMGWMIFNGLYQKSSLLWFQETLDSGLMIHAKGLLDELAEFFNDDSLPDYLHSDPAWSKVFVLLHSGHVAEGNVLHTAEYLVQNSWKEMFFYSQPLSHIENNMLKCYEIGRQIRNYLENSSTGCEYRLFPARELDDTTITRTINDFVRSKLE